MQRHPNGKLLEQCSYIQDHASMCFPRPSRVSARYNSILLADYLSSAAIYETAFMCSFFLPVRGSTCEYLSR